MMILKLMCGFLFLSCFDICRAAHSCDMSGAEKIKVGRLCPWHEHRTVSSYVDSDGRIGHCHYEDGPTIFWQDVINLKVALRGAKTKS